MGDALTNIDGRVTNIEDSVTTLNQQINNGEIGLVCQDATTGAITVAADTNGSVVDVAGTDGARIVTGVADGAITSGSTDAVNGGQIYALEQQLGVVNNQLSVHAQTVTQSTDQAAAYTDQQVGAALRSANIYTDSRIDTYDAIVQNRVYSKARTHHTALKIISDGRRSLFDPWVADTFIRIAERAKSGELNESGLLR
ncbi:hypothetical protein G3N59_02585 [Paraburkholderia sp. Ac-20340]|uniref:hypothetical protein n=1 Tax=Paraburkholderia sp. Ac-20340 TaxID=2703888 RepID=UPI00198261E6|nr:hypothetical protein [Paraburkholderia sp. Ac-20340]